VANQTSFLPYFLNKTTLVATN